MVRAHYRVLVSFPGNAIVGAVPGLDDDRLAILFASTQPAFHSKGVWTLRIAAQRHRSSQRVRDFLALLEGIRDGRCQTSSSFYNTEFCESVGEAYNTTAESYDQLFPDEDFDVGRAPANTSVFIPEHVPFHEVSVSELWSQLHDGAGQHVFIDRFALLKLGELIRAKAARLKHLVDVDGDMWTDLLVHSTASTNPASTIACSVLEDAFAHATSMLPLGLSFKGPLTCTALPPLTARRSAREVSLSVFLDVGVVCGDILALPLPKLLNDTHFLTLAVREGSVLSCAEEPHGHADLKCAAGLYRDGTDPQNACPIESLRSDRAFVVHGKGQIYLVSQNPVAVVFKFSFNGSMVSRRAKLQGRKLITYGVDTIVLLKGLSSRQYDVVKLVPYVPGDPQEIVVDLAELDPALYVLIFIILMCIFVPCFIFMYFLYFAKKLIWAASNI